MKLLIISLLAVNVGLSSAGLTNLRLREKFLAGSKCTVANKEDCGYYGIKEDGCEAKGCCWDPNQPSTEPWCYFGNKSPSPGPSPTPSPTPGPGSAPFSDSEMKLMQGYFEDNLNVKPEDVPSIHSEILSRAAHLRRIESG